MTDSSNNTQQAAGSIVIVGGKTTQSQSFGIKLQQLGMRVAEFQRGADALLHLREHESDLLYLIGYPTDMNALTFVRACRSAPTYSVTPIMMLADPEANFGPSERTFLASYQVTLVLARLTDLQKILLAANKVLAARKDDRSQQSRIERAKRLLREGLIWEAKKIYEELVKETGTDIMARVGLAKSVLSPKEQLVQLETLLSQDPQNYNFRFEMIANYVRQGLLSKAERLLGQVITDLDQSGEVFWLNELATICVGQKVLPYAVKVAEKVTKSAPRKDAWRAEMILSRTHLAAGNEAGAELHLNKAINLAGIEHPEIENMRAIIARRSGDHRAALIAFTKALTHFPDDYRVIYNIGLCHESQGNNTKALESFRQALVISPTFTKAQSRVEKLSTNTDN